MNHKNELLNNKFTTIHNFFSVEEIDEVEIEIDKTLPANIRELTHIDINRPSRIRKKILRLPVFEKCKTFSENFFQKECHCLYDHAIYKFGLCDVATRWHQDQAYLGKGVSINSLNFWIPMQDTSDINGGLMFMKDSPSFLMPHKKVVQRGVTQLMIDFDHEPEFSKDIVYKGGVSIHDNFAVHASTINRSQFTRKAWIIHFSPTSAWVKRLYQFKSYLIEPKKQ